MRAEEPNTLVYLMDGGKNSGVNRGRGEDNCSSFLDFISNAGDVNLLALGGVKLENL